MGTLRMLGIWLSFICASGVRMGLEQLGRVQGLGLTQGYIGLYKVI